MNLEILFLKIRLIKMKILSELSFLFNHQFQFYNLEDWFHIKSAKSINSGIKQTNTVCLVGYNLL